MNKYSSQKAFHLLSFLFCALFVCGSSLLHAQSKAASPDPYLTFETPLHNFGTIKKGEVKSHVFKFTNTGKETIKIDFITVGCECTELVEPVKRTYKPGESGEIKAIYDSGKEEEYGELDKYFEVVLVNTDKKTGRQIIKEANFKVVVVK